VEENSGLGEHGLLGLGRGRGWVFRNFVDHFMLRKMEMGAGRILGGDVKGTEDELGAAEVDGIADEGVDDFHERGLDRLRVFEEGHGMKARLGRRVHAADETLVEIAEKFAAQGGRAAGNSLTLMWVQMRIALLTAIEFEPSGFVGARSGSNKFPDRVCKLLNRDGLESQRPRKPA
jgi:hypothetical protein